MTNLEVTKPLPDVEAALMAALASVAPAHLPALNDLLAAIRHHRPVGFDGQHGELHTPTCGCRGAAEFGDGRLPAAFWTKVEESPAGCWLWLGSKFRHGYGRFNNPLGSKYAHRFAYVALIGPVPEGRELDHLCRQRHCVNPAHLDPVDHLTNVRRGRGSEAAANVDTCRNGLHPWPESAVERPSTGALYCRECRRATAKRANAKRRDCPQCGLSLATSALNRHVRNQHKEVAS